jgi:hypothetical protein
MLSDDVEWDRSLPKKGQLEVPEAFTSAYSRKISPVRANTIKELQTYITNGPNFSEAVNGPMPNNITMAIPLKVWARTKRNDVLKFFKQKSSQDKL